MKIKMKRSDVFNFFQALELCKVRPIDAKFRYAIKKNQDLTRGEITATDEAFPVDPQDGYLAELAQAGAIADQAAQEAAIVAVEAKYQEARKKRAEQVRLRDEHMKAEVEVEVWRFGLPHIPPGGEGRDANYRDQLIVEALVPAIAEV